MSGRGTERSRELRRKRKRRKEAIKARVQESRKAGAKTTTTIKSSE